MRILKFVALAVALCCLRSARAEFTIDLAHPQPNAPKEAVLFPLDNYSIPLRKGVEMNLLTSEHTRAPYNPVLRRGKPGAPDSFRIGYYGTVIEINHRFHMWYIGDGDQDPGELSPSTCKPSGDAATRNPGYGRVMFQVTCTVPVTPFTESVSGAG